MSRVRSPNYPALSLADAITRIRDVYKAQQTTPEPRTVVMGHMGYSSANGRAMKSLSALIKYGLLEGSNEEGLSVSDRAIAILYPDPDDLEAKQNALLAAAHAPALFAEIFDRWDHRPTETSLEAFLIRKGFNANSIENVTRAFYGTYDLVEDIKTDYGTSSTEQEPQAETELEDQSMGQVSTPPPQAEGGISQTATTQELNSTKPVFDFDTVAISTKIDNQEDLSELIERLEQIKTMLPNKTQH